VEKRRKRDHLAHHLLPLHPQNHHPNGSKNKKKKRNLNLIFDLYI